MDGAWIFHSVALKYTLSQMDNMRSPFTPSQSGTGCSQNNTEGTWSSKVYQQLKGQRRSITALMFTQVPKTVVWATKANTIVYKCAQNIGEVVS